MALLTGAARRVGAAIARDLHAAGLRVLIHYRGSRADADALVDELERQRPDSARALQADLLDPEAINRLAREAEAAWGRLDFLVNNASTFYATPVGAIDAAAWDDLLGSNLKAPTFLTQACAPALQRAHGAVVNIVDIHALRPLKGYPVYSAAKAGLWALTQAYARELGPGVRVNGVAPGAILSPEDPANAGTHEAMVERTALKREGSPQDIARTVRFLLLDAPYITGQVIPVDGGRSASQ
ncbi:pteridine reductase [Thioalkalivibrio sp. ALJ16]|uniref:pteridine reductase n=1 Tax=Thioalkalivibrio sp. ALJ16 TaxID=1158762 RepID=UPI000476E4C6|nr:pteridine reductase [Thioalkalivibrio sp. ALJ16]